MKADEFSKRLMDKKHKKAAESKAAIEGKSKRIIADSEHQQDLAMPNPELNEDYFEVYGAEYEPGHEIGRIRHTQPDVWARIKNWD